ncbi:MAG TPA: Xaa-Pro peptidase family protein [Isosphaeraceae bacterium]|jgi:Xaa-Pro aminopeptidase|nr:Xaa-Pro peptidase family protein [Isosphaeraceae bacterium]
MPTPEGCSSRRARLWRHLPAECDLAIVADPKNLAYFANYAPSPFTFRTNDDVALLVLAPDRATLVGDDMIWPFLDEAHADEVVAPTWYDGKRSAPHRQKMLVHTTLDVLKKYPGHRVGFEPGSLPAGVVEGLRQARPGLELVDLSDAIRDLRRAKDPDEVEAIRRAIRAGEAGFAAALERVEPGMTEFEAYRLIEDACLAAAGERAIVYGDFVSGPRADGIIGPPTHRRLQRGDLFILDFSVVLRGYRGDFANTICVGGAPTPRQRELFEACLAGMSAGEALLRPGTAARDVDAALRHAIAARGGDPDFQSHSGHGIGLGHPEPPYIVPDSAETLRAGDVVTLEPGQYIAGVGNMRFERNYLVTPAGPETLTHHALTLTRG